MKFNLNKFIDLSRFNKHLASLNNLNNRERYAVYGAITAVFLFVLFQFIINPIMNKKTELDRKLKTATADLQQMHSLKAKYDQLKKTEAHTKNRFRGPRGKKDLFSFLDTHAGSSGLKKNVTSMRPSKSKKDNKYEIEQVEMELKGITMEQLTDYLHKVETSRQIKAYIDRISIAQKNRKDGTINAALQVQTIKVLDNNE